MPELETADGSLTHTRLPPDRDEISPSLDTWEELVKGRVQLSSKISEDHLS